MGARELLDRSGSVPRLHNVVPGPTQPVGHRLVDHRLVLDHQNPAAHSVNYHAPTIEADLVSKVRRLVKVLCRFQTVIVTVAHGIDFQSA